MIIKKKIGIVVLFWNDYEKTIECIKSIYNQRNLHYTLILVDNNSQKKYSNEILKWLKNNKKEVINVKKKNTKKKNLVHQNYVSTLKIDLTTVVVLVIIQDINFA